MPYTVNRRLRQLVLAPSQKDLPQHAIIDAKDDLCTRFLRRLGRPRLLRREPPRLLLFSPIRGPDLLDLGVGF